MPLTSPVSAVEAPRPEGEVLPLKVSRLRRNSARPQWPEALGTIVWRGFVPILHGLRRSWFYRQTLRGFLPDRFSFHPEDPRARRLEEADAIMRGRFRLAGAQVELDKGSIFDVQSPSPEFAAALHGFDWLRHLEAAGGEVAHDVALGLTTNWLKRHARYTLPAWQPEIVAERLYNLLAHGQFFLANTDLVWRSKLFVSLRDQTVVLSRSLDEVPDGLPRLKTAAALTLAGFSLGDARSAAHGLKRLATEIDTQILPDGGHASRSPEALLEAYRLLAAVQVALDEAGWTPDVALRAALDRIAPMLRFLRMGDGALPCFNGGNEGDAGVMAAYLEDAEGDTRPFGLAASSGYQRLAAGRTLLLLDAGCAPPQAMSTAAHAGCLAFEMSSGAGRMIVNCGKPLARDPRWDMALRATAAHSTLTLNDTSQGMVQTSGMAARLLGPRLMGGPSVVETRRTQGAQGLQVDCTHDAYAAQFGLLHQRRLTLNPRGTTLMGGDRLIPVDAKGWGRSSKTRAARDGIPFAVRFHVHPDVRLSKAQARGAVILKLPGGEGWRFRCAGGALTVEESIYFGGGAPRRSEQLVVNGVLDNGPAEIAWMFEQVNAG